MAPDHDWPLERILAVIDDATVPTTILDDLSRLQDLASQVTVLLVQGASGPDTAPIGDGPDRHGTIPAAVEVTVAGSRSEAVASILETARALDVDMIVAVPGVARRGHAGSGSGVATSTNVIEDLALHADMPVMMLRAGVSEHASSLTGVVRIVAPLNGSAVSIRALPIAMAFSRQLAAPIHLVTVLDPACALPPAYAYLPSNDPEFRDAVSSLQRQANDALNKAEVMVRAAGIDVTSELIFGPTGPCIISSIRDGDWVVMTTHGEGKPSRFGSVAAGIAHEAPAPVVIVPTPVRTAAPERALAGWDVRAATASGEEIRPYLGVGTTVTCRNVMFPRS